MPRTPDTPSGDAVEPVLLPEERAGGHGARRVSFHLRWFRGGHRRFGRRAGRAGAPVRCAAGGHRRGLRGDPAPVARSQVDDGQPAGALHRDAGAGGQPRHAARAQRGVPDPARQEHAHCRRPAAAHPQARARALAADRRVLHEHGRAMCRPRHRGGALRHRQRRLARHPGRQRRGWLRLRARADRCQVRRHAAQRGGHRPGRRGGPGRGAGRAPDRAPARTAARLDAPAGRHPATGCGRAPGRHPRVAAGQQRHRLPRLQADHRAAPHRAPHAGAAHRLAAGLPRSTGELDRRTRLCCGANC